ncbi:MAG: tRNA uridine-5-carboxymethylaminomethyl(34) synthesis GTPase MnmE [Eubacteriales bacterium]
MSHVIAALSTGNVLSAIGILRLSGDGAVEVASKVFRAKNGKNLTEYPNHRMILGHLLDTKGRVLDEILAVVARGPHSYTGEDTVEFQCHGSPAVLAEGLSALFQAGARQATAGEFTKRAFLSGNLDLTQAEAVIDLIHAETAEQAANAAGQLGGAILSKIDPIYTDLTQICSHFHAVLDYPDEDIEDFQLVAFQGQIAEGIATLSQFLESFQRGKILKSGISTVILGKPNAGKSSLLNALAGFDRAIVTDIEGTTRDAVTETVRLGDRTLRLTDTAGIRETLDPIEAIGIAKAEQAAGDADLALLVLDGSRPLSPEDFRVLAAAEQVPKVIALVNKGDLSPAFDPGELPLEALAISAKKSTGLDKLEEKVGQMFPTDGNYDGSILTNTRQAEAITRAKSALENAQNSMAGHTPDAVLMDVEEAMSALGELTGRTVREDITADIFARFCVGK